MTNLVVILVTALIASICSFAIYSFVGEKIRKSKQTRDKIVGICESNINFWGFILMNYAVVITPIMYIGISKVLEPIMEQNEVVARIWPLLSVILLMMLYGLTGRLAKGKLLRTNKIIKGSELKMTKSGLLSVGVLGILLFIVKKDADFLFFLVTAMVVYLGFFVPVECILGITTDENISKERKRNASKKQKGSDNKKMDKYIAGIQLFIIAFGIAVYLIPSIGLVIDGVIGATLGVIFFLFTVPIDNADEEMNHLK